MAQGTTLSFWPEMISNGPLCGFLESTLISVHGFRLAVAASNSGTPEGVGDLAGRFMGEPFRVGVRLADCLGIVGPAGSHRRETGLIEDVRPAIPAAGQQPQAMYEDNGRAAARIGFLDLLVDRDARWRGAGFARRG